MPVVSVSGCSIENGCPPRGFIVGSESPGLCPSLADARAEIARLRGALEAVYELAHDPAILTICREATR